MEKLAQNHATQLVDLLGGRLAFERTGVKLYDNVIRKIEAQGDPRYRAILDQLRHNRDEEQEHAQWLEQQILGIGGSPGAQTEMAQLESEESRGIEGIICDGHQNVMHLLHALLAAELSDNAGWDMLVKLADEAGDRVAKIAFARRLAEEAKHLLYVREIVVRSAENEVLGRALPMPADTTGMIASKLKKPLLLGGVATALTLGIGALAASAILIARPRLARKVRAAI